MGTVVEKEQFSNVELREANGKKSNNRTGAHFEHRREIRRPQYKIDDWLTLHGLTSNLTVAALNQIEDQLLQSTETVPPEFLPRSEFSASNIVWRLCKNAWIDQFPDKAAYIAETARATELNVREERIDGLGPLTIAQEEGQPPVISMCFSGTCLDAMAMAHEFGHALQIFSEPGRFIVPVSREISAFISELVFLRYLSASGHRLASEATAAHVADNSGYFLEDACSLARALQQLNSSYDYRWNYPLARHLATQVFAEGTKEHMWDALMGKVSLVELLKKHMELER
ncbi:MAG: hypothetical protein ABJN14_07535 [Paracoccaceae bacterium]